MSRFRLLARVTERVSLSSSPGAGLRERARGTLATSFTSRTGPPGSGHSHLLPGGGGSSKEKGKGGEVSLHLGLIRLHS